MPEIQLKSNWAGYVPGSIVSVSDERAKYLVTSLKIARYASGQHVEEEDKKQPAKGKK